MPRTKQQKVDTYCVRCQRKTPTIMAGSKRMRNSRGVEYTQCKCGVCGGKKAIYGSAGLFGRLGGMALGSFISPGLGTIVGGELGDSIF